jgi:glycosyltransferase involved in cell wall biosynthesis
MRILYLTGRERGYTRNDVLLRALQHLGSVYVIADVPSGPLLWRSAVVFARALPRLIRRRYDLVFVGFYGHLLMLPIGLLSHAPILFDAFVSTFDTLCFDRQVFAPNSLGGSAAFWLDKIACHLASVVLVDTPLQADYFMRMFNLKPETVRSTPVGCNEDIFHPRHSAPQEERTIVLYYSTYQPLHGVDTVVRAAALLREQPQIHFRLLGMGQTFDQVHRLAEELRLQNIGFVPFVPLQTLADEIGSAGICLGGHFGASSKAGRVVPGKIYQILAMGRPLLAADTPANRELLTHQETAYLCPPADPAALASAILELHRDASLREHLAARGRTLYLVQCSESVIAERLQRLVREMTGKSA